MFLSFKALEQSGVEVVTKKDGVELIPRRTWSDAAPSPGLAEIPE